jgi:3-hydroxymyristoyl/3-hydroxydecanoyl-(acyl carrier protein) dehydratase
VRFKKVVVPGDQLVIHTRLTRRARKIFEFDAAASVDNIIVSHGKLKAVAGISM